MRAAKPHVPVHRGLLLVSCGSKARGSASTQHAGTTTKTVCRICLRALTFDTTEVPDLGADQLLVQMHAVSLNQRDLMLMRGVYMPDVQRPRIPCFDGAGEVLATGSNVTEFKVGDPCCTMSPRPLRAARSDLS